MPTKRQKTFLFVCEANQRRSRAAEDLCAGLVRNRNLPIKVCSAGMSQQADTPITRAMADQADLIFVMEDHMKQDLQRTYGQPAAKIVCLDIPDEYERDSLVLLRLLRDGISPYLAQ